jgi:RNA polymerase sigma-70 factor (ECF subfamily)
MADDASSVKSSERSSLSSISSTHWSVVFAAGKDSSPEARAAFGELYTAYLPPLLTYLRSKGNSHERAMDLLHGFFEHLLETKGLSKVRKTGKFRTWLLRTLQNYITDVWRKGQAIKRDPGQPHLPIGTNVENGEVEPADTRLSPEQAYDRKWAIALLKRVLSKLAAEYAHAGKQAEFGELKDFLPGGHAASSYQEVGKRLNMQPNAVAQAVKRLRERYAELLWAEISDTVEPEMVEAEWRHLRDALGGRPETASDQPT